MFFFIFQNEITKNSTVHLTLELRIGLRKSVKEKWDEERKSEKEKKEFDRKSEEKKTIQENVRQLDFCKTDSEHSAENSILKCLKVHTHTYPYTNAHRESDTVAYKV